MFRRLSITVIALLVAACAPGALPEEQDGTGSQLKGNDGDDLASIADGADTTGDTDGIPFVPAVKGGFTSGRTDKIQFVVIHDIEGSGTAGVETFRASDAKVSAHYVIDKFGVAVQMVHEADSAFHSGSHHFNDTAIGIEHSGFASEDGYTEAEYTASAKLVAKIVTRYSIPIDRAHIVGHSQVPSTEDEPDACTPDRTDCGGRNHHDDPGAFWDWDGYLAKVQAEVDVLGKKDPTVTPPSTVSTTPEVPLLPPPAVIPLPAPLPLPVTPPAPVIPKAPVTPPAPPSSSTKDSTTGKHAPSSETTKSPDDNDDPVPTAEPLPKKTTSPAAAKKKKVTSASGCSAAATGSPVESGLPALLLAVAALGARRRRR